MSEFTRPPELSPPVAAGADSSNPANARTNTQKRAAAGKRLNTTREAINTTRTSAWSFMHILRMLYKIHVVLIASLRAASSVIFPLRLVAVGLELVVGALGAYLAGQEVSRSDMIKALAVLGLEVVLAVTGVLVPPVSIVTLLGLSLIGLYHENREYERVADKIQELERSQAQTRLSSEERHDLNAQLSDRKEALKDAKVTAKLAVVSLIGAAMLIIPGLHVVGMALFAGALLTGIGYKIGVKVARALDKRAEKQAQHIATHAEIDEEFAHQPNSHLAAQATRRRSPIQQGTPMPQQANTRATFADSLRQTGRWFMTGLAAFTLAFGMNVTVGAQVKDAHASIKPAPAKRPDAVVIRREDERSGSARDDDNSDDDEYDRIGSDTQPQKIARDLRVTESDQQRYQRHVVTDRPETRAREYDAARLKHQQRRFIAEHRITTNTQGEQPADTPTATLTH